MKKIEKDKNNFTFKQLTIIASYFAISNLGIEPKLIKNDGGWAVKVGNGFSFIGSKPYLSFKEAFYKSSFALNLRGDIFNNEYISWMDKLYNDTDEQINNQIKNDKELQELIKERKDESKVNRLVSDNLLKNNKTLDENLIEEDRKYSVYFSNTNKEITVTDKEAEDLFGKNPWLNYKDGSLPHVIVTSLSESNKLEEKKETDPSLKYPKEWLPKLPGGLKGYIWSKLDDKKREEIRARYGKHYGPANSSNDIISKLILGESLKNIILSLIK